MSTSSSPVARPAPCVAVAAASSASSAPPARLFVEEIATLPALEALVPEWERLWAATPSATPFQSPHWLLPWWRHIGRGRLMTLAMRLTSDQTLVGLVPLYLYTGPADGQRHLFPVGIATTDYLDLLAGPGSEAPVVASLRTHLASRQDEWDVFEFPQLRRASPLLTQSLPADLSPHVEEGEPNPVLALRTPSGPGPEFPPSILDNLRYYRRRADRAGRWTCDTADADTIPAFLDAVFRLHTQRWSTRGLPGVLADADVLASHRDAAPRFHAAGLLRLHALRLDRNPIAVLYCLADPPCRDAPRHYYYIGGFDPDFASLSPGTLLIAHAIERAMQEGAAAFDFLRGREAYKYRWGARDQPMYTLRLRHDRATRSSIDQPSAP